MLAGCRAARAPIIVYPIAELITCTMMTCDCAGVAGIQLWPCVNTAVLYLHCIYTVFTAPVSQIRVIRKRYIDVSGEVGVWCVN